MRPPQKSNRARGRGNRKPNGGNTLNRVFESAGPEGKVRGTPQQVIEKYTSLARDAHTSGDRVMAENFLQHAEHYQRILLLALAGQADRANGQVPAEDEDEDDIDSTPSRFDVPRPPQFQQPDQQRHEGRGGDPRQEGGQPRFESQRGDPRHEGQRRDQPRHEGQRGDQPRHEGQRGDQPRHESPRGEPRQEGPRHERRPEGQRPEGPRPEGHRNDGPRRDERRPEREDAPPAAAEPAEPVALAVVAPAAEPGPAPLIDAMQTIETRPDEGEDLLVPVEEMRAPPAPARRRRTPRAAKAAAEDAPAPATADEPAAE